MTEKSKATPAREYFSLAFALTIALSVLASLAVACHKPGASTKRLFTASPLKPCKLPNINEELLCGKLTVFENREARSGRTIELSVVVLPALDPGLKEEPLFDLTGGPGVGASGSADFYAKEGKAYRRHRDVVLVDQRGTGNSNPLAAAPRTRSPQDYLTEMYPVEYVKALRQALEQKADLTQYTTSIAVDDLDDVRAWLGYDRINLFGLSYGTRAVLVYMRQHPDRVRSAILMGGGADLSHDASLPCASSRACDAIIAEGVRQRYRLSRSVPATTARMGGRAGTTGTATGTDRVFAA